jgi:DnaJ-class molecular chaperone
MIIICQECGGSYKEVTCPECEGSGLVIKYSPGYGDEYTVCDLCNGLKKVKRCRVCGGIYDKGRG